MDISPFLNRINAVIINPLIILLFAIAFLVFFWGIFEFLSGMNSGIEKDGKKTYTGREEGKKKIVYGLIGLFIMFSAYGIMRLVLGTFGLSQPSYLNSQNR